MTKLLTIGILGKSCKADEKRVAIHPEHISFIPLTLRKQLTFECGYGVRFGMSDDSLAKLTSGRVASRTEILNDFDCILMPKPVEKDLQEVKDGAVIWGWLHCVQQTDIAQLAIDKKLTLITWEEMFTWSQFGEKLMHIFYKNNEIAGHAGVTHALNLIGTNGHYGKPLKAAVFSFGSVSRGAVYALQAQGLRDIVVYTERPHTEVRDQLPGVSFKQLQKNDKGDFFVVESDGSNPLLIDYLSEVQIIVNGTLQNIDNPKMFINKYDSKKLAQGTLIIDISCDEGMGFWCAKPTSFKDPLLEVEGKFYYSVDHSPSYYWNSASWEISEAVRQFLPLILKGPEAWEKNNTILRAIDISNGKINNTKIISFQNRTDIYPYECL